MTDPNGVPRLRMLDTIREFGSECLTAAGESDSVMRHLLDWGWSLLDGIEAAAFTSAQGDVLDRVEAEHDNLRAVVVWAIEKGDPATAQNLIQKVGWFWFAR